MDGEYFTAFPEKPTKSPLYRFRESGTIRTYELHSETFKLLIVKN
jgi:hypothetical protein